MSSPSTATMLRETTAETIKQAALVETFRVREVAVAKKRPISEMARRLW
ncbi:MAG: hypothetical protein ACLQNE_22820 [Thermoguttaceae bacterium]